jgi:hypothetical protein
MSTTIDTTGMDTDLNILREISKTDADVLKTGYNLGTNILESTCKLDADILKTGNHLQQDISRVDANVLKTGNESYCLDCDNIYTHCGCDSNCGCDGNCGCSTNCGCSFKCCNTKPIIIKNIINNTPQIEPVINVPHPINQSQEPDTNNINIYDNNYNSANASNAVNTTLNNSSVNDNNNTNSNSKPDNGGSENGDDNGSGNDDDNGNGDDKNRDSIASPLTPITAALSQSDSTFNSIAAPRAIPEIPDRSRP